MLWFLAGVLLMAAAVTASATTTLRAVLGPAPGDFNAAIAFAVFSFAAAIAAYAS